MTYVLLLIAACTAGEPPPDETPAACSAEGPDAEACGPDAFCVVDPGPDGTRGSVDDGEFWCRDLCAYPTDCGSYCCEAVSPAGGGAPFNACGPAAACVASRGSACEALSFIYCEAQVGCSGGRQPGACRRLFMDDCCATAGSCEGPGPAPEAYQACAAALDVWACGEPLPPRCKAMAPELRPLLPT